MTFFRNSKITGFWISLLVVSLVSFCYYFISISKTDRHYIYTLDDAYIHLAMAKNFALHSVWGVTPYEFSSTSSSPLFTFLISVMIQVWGNNDQLPLYFNIVFGIGTVFLLSRYYSDVFKAWKNIVPAVLFTVFFTVLYLQVLSGMEHVLQVFLFVTNIFCFSRWDKNKYYVAGFYAGLLLMGLIRFESMFYFVILAFVFLLLKKWKEALGVLLAGFVPVIIFCYFNYLQDGYLFPNSVVVKGTKLSFDSNLPVQFKNIFLDNFLLNPSFYKIGFFPLVLSAILIYRESKNNSFAETIRKNFLLIVFSLLMICHSMFADLKGLFRYEAYILTGFSMVLIPRISSFFTDFKSYIKKEKLVTFLIIMNVVLLLYKCQISHRMLINGGKNIYEQQIQSASFLHTYYNTTKVVANDIGAITYYTDIHLLDIAGLGSKEMIPFNENKGLFDKRFEDFLTQYGRANQYKIAVVYEEWLQGHVPKTWKKAAVLKIRNKTMVARDEVSIYSIDGQDVQLLKQNIRDFNWNKNVKVTIFD